MAERVLAAMSGGVDSSVAAYVMKALGFEVIGITMQLWDARGSSPVRTGRCCSVEDTFDAKRVASQLGIRHYVVNLESQFRETVVQPFIEAYRRGFTPIPCVSCNTVLKFGYLLYRAFDLDCRYVVTGHYARNVYDVHTRTPLLFRARDRGKDQSYFLFELSREQLLHALFPLGNLSKQEVRNIACELGLPVADKPDSQQLCFIPEGDYRAFLRKYDPNNPEEEGNMVTIDGHVVGRHPGVHHFTLGQRKGLGVALGRPMYVVGLEPQTKRVIIGPEKELYNDAMYVEGVNWILPPQNEEVSAWVQIRYRHTAAQARIYPRGTNTALVLFTTPQRAITPGQAAVFYDAEGMVLGGGWIRRGGEVETLCRDYGFNLPEATKRKIPLVFDTKGQGR